MSQPQGRGGRGDRGRSDRGRGQGGGDRGAFGGSDRGRGGGGRGAWGGPDRGRGGGDRGGWGGGGRGGGRGGGGSYNESDKDDKLYRPANILSPNAEVTKIENEFIKNLSGITGFESLSLTSSFPTRPGHGSTGVAYNVFSNYFEIKLKALKTGIVFYRYNVEVNAEGKAPKASKVKIKRLINLLLEDQRFHGALTDYRSTLLSSSEIQGITGDIIIPFRAEGESTPPATPAMYRITVQATGTVQVSEYAETLKSADPGQQPYLQRNEVFQALNTVFGHFPQQRSDLVTVGQNKHFKIKPIPDYLRLGGGLDALRGFFKSVRPATNRLLLNVNVSHAVFFAPLRLDALYWELDVVNNPRQVVKKLKLLRVDRLHLKPKTNTEKVFPATFWDFASTNDGQAEPHPPQVRSYGAGPKDVKFFLTSSVPPATKGPAGKASKAAGSASGQYISVWDYFSKNYPSFKLDNKHPVINVGNRQNPRYLPAEVCEVIPGQPVGSKLNSAQTSSMIKFACRTPGLNAQSISDAGRKVLGLDEDQSAGLEKLGLHIERDLITVQARILQPPQIKYSGQNQAQAKVVNPSNGGWNMIGSKFNKSSSISNWSYVEIMNGSSYWKDPNSLVQIVKNLVTHLREKTGLNIAKDPSIRPGVVTIKRRFDAEQANNKAIEDCLSHYSKQGSKYPLFLLIVLPFYDGPIYSTVKRLADTKAGIHTVCVVAEKLSKSQMQYWGNIALKFNLKAGGTNHILDPSKLGIISEGKTMVVGIDVTHPSPQSRGSAPSVAGIVASVDRTLGQWPAALSVQESRKEMVSALKELFKSRLQVWSNRNSKQLPENIIIYRDGVSEGQYQTVLESELPLIRQACSEMYPPKVQPALSIIIVGKRHHTRFYPTKEADMDEKNGGNCKPGTIVDRGVTEVRFWHFYLQAHAAIKGTARPAHYYVILDEVFRYKIKAAPADALEELTHNMCHLFGRATRAVSICPPAYYADLVCERARCYLSRVFDPSDSGSTAAGSQAGDNAQQSDVNIHPNLKDTMFYI